MRNENIFMSRKRRYGLHPNGKRLKVLRPNSEPSHTTKMDRHDQSLADRNIGNAWWETIHAARWARRRA